MEKITQFVQNKTKDHWGAMEHMPFASLKTHTDDKIITITSEYVYTIRGEMFKRINDQKDISPEDKTIILRELDQLFESI